MGNTQKPGVPTKNTPGDKVVYFCIIVAAGSIVCGVVMRFGLGWRFGQEAHTDAKLHAEGKTELRAQPGNDASQQMLQEIKKQNEMMPQENAQEEEQRKTQEQARRDAEVEAERVSRQNSGFTVQTSKEGETNFGLLEGGQRNGVWYIKYVGQRQGWSATADYVDGKQTGYLVLYDERNRVSWVTSMLNNMRHGDDIWFSENGGGMVKRFAYDKVINNNVYPDAPGFLPKPVIEKAAGEVARHAAALKELRSLKDREGVK